MLNIRKTIEKASKILGQSNVPDPRREARSLLVLALQKDEGFLFAHPEYELTSEESGRFAKFLERRAGREPFHHISGRREFYGLDFSVSRDVLIPRPETEMLVEESIRILSGIDNPRFCEIGVGSGCIAVAILHNARSAVGTGLEISEKALRIAAKNARAHGVAGRLRLMKSDVFGAISGGPQDNRMLNYPDQFDLIVSNPPYVPQSEMSGLQPEVRRFDPEIALTEGKDGLSIIREIVAQSPRFLVSGGYLLLEIGSDQSNSVNEMFTTDFWCLIEILPDFQGIPRMVRARKSRGRGEHM